MATIDSITLEVADTTAAEHFYAAAFDLGPRLRLRPAEGATDGFRGFTVSLLVAQPATVDAVVDAALGAGATALKPAAKSLWGYGGVVQAPDGTIWTVASSTKKDTGPATRQVDDVVLQLGVSDVTASREFYSGRGLTPAKSFGRKYVELDTGEITLTLAKASTLAKTAGLSASPDTAPRLTIHAEGADFTDPDGFVWEPV